jgi:hypothetical protein
MAIKIVSTTENLPGNGVRKMLSGPGTAYPNLRPKQPGQQLLPCVYDGLRKHRSIKNFLLELHDEECSGEILTAFRHYFPKLRKMTMREAWLRVVYMEAIAAAPWASMFIADRSEGKVGEGGIANDKGTILSSIEQMLNNPVTEEIE